MREWLRLDTEWACELGRPECPFVRRWMMQTRFGSVRLHHWISSDDSRAPHDHPWWFVTLVLFGSYDDISMRVSGGAFTEPVCDRLISGSVRFRRKNHIHWVRTRGCWTLVVTGPASGDWGFYLPRKLDRVVRFLSARRYFFDHGHHPCEDAGATSDPSGRESTTPR